MLQQSQGILDPNREAMRLARLFDQAAAWLEMVDLYSLDVDHGDTLLLDKVLRPLAHRQSNRARELRELSEQANATIECIRNEYDQLTTLFDVEITSFERKR